MKKKFDENEPIGQGTAADTPEKRAELLKSYVTRLSEGENLETVRSDFVKNFKSVDAAEIAKAEQELIQGGAKISDVQRLCDVHSALFHGATREEQIENAEAAVMDSLNKKDSEKETEQNFAAISGHPVNIFMAENEKINSLIEAVKAALDKDTDISGLVKKARALRSAVSHYAKKGDLIYPLLNRTYGYSGPANVMWGVDDEIRDELKSLTEAAESLSDFRDQLEKVVVRAEEMIYKENNILYPLCIQNFSDEDWMRIYYELSSYDTLLTDGYPVWEEAEKRRAELKTIGGKTAGQEEATDKKPAAKETIANETGSDMITLGSGHMTPEQILAVLDTIPMEITFVDEGNINRFFNDGEKLFKRPDMAIDREVFSCHPPKYEAMVRKILDSFRTGERDHVDVWMTKGGEPVLVKYMAVKDSEGKYLGTLECVQNMRPAKEHFTEEK